MQNKIVFKDNKCDSILFDSKKNTLTFNNVNDTYYVFFDGFICDSLKINVINSNVTIIENYIGKIDKCHFEIDIDNNSILNRFSIVNDVTNRFVCKRVIDNKGIYKSMQIDLSKYSVDSTEDINLNEIEANALVIDGIYAINKANKKYQTNLNHFKGQSVSKAQIFAINNDEAHVQIYTDAYIKNKASHVVTNQEGRIINLSDTCSGIVLPNLHIDENDVEASHSCSVGSVNKEHMYYLCSRGLSELQARNILIKGYFNPILKEISDEAIKEQLSEVIDKRIG